MAVGIEVHRQVGEHVRDGVWVDEPEGYVRKSKRRVSPPGPGARRSDAYDTRSWRGM